MAITLIGAAIGFAIHPAVAIIMLLLTVLSLPLTVRLFYRLNKSGLVVWVREKD